MCCGGRLRLTSQAAAGAGSGLGGDRGGDRAAFAFQVLAGEDLEVGLRHRKADIEVAVGRDDDRLAALVERAAVDRLAVERRAVADRALAALADRSQGQLAGQAFAVDDGDGLAAGDLGAVATLIALLHRKYLLGKGTSFAHR